MLKICQIKKCLWKNYYIIEKKKTSKPAKDFQKEKKDAIQNKCHKKTI